MLFVVDDVVADVGCAGMIVTRRLKMGFFRRVVEGVCYVVMKRWRGRHDLMHLMLSSFGSNIIIGKGESLH